MMRLAHATSPRLQTWRLSDAGRCRDRCPNAGLNGIQCPHLGHAGACATADVLCLNDRRGGSLRTPAWPTSRTTAVIPRTRRRPFFLMDVAGIQCPYLGHAGAYPTADALRLNDRRGGSLRIPRVATARTAAVIPRTRRRPFFLIEVGSSAFALTLVLAAASRSPCRPAALDKPKSPPQGLDRRRGIGN